MSFQFYELKEETEILKTLFKNRKQSILIDIDWKFQKQINFTAF